MAYSDVALDDLVAIGEMFRKIGGDAGNGVVGNLRFNAADQLLMQLDDVKRGLQEVLATRGYERGWGPGYGNEEDSPGAKTHQLGISLYKTAKNTRRIEAYFVFPERRSDPIRWTVYAYDYGKDRYIAEPKDIPAERLFKDGVLSAKLLRDSVRDFATEHKLKA